MKPMRIAFGEKQVRISVPAKLTWRQFWRFQRMVNAIGIRSSK